MFKHRKTVICTAILLIITITVCGFIIFSENKYQDLYVYETNGQIIELFEENIADFDEYVDKFEDHAMWDSYYEKTGDSDFVNYKGFEQFTTEEEFAYLDSFYRKYHPAFWGRRSLGFYVKSGHVTLIKDDELTSHTEAEIEKSKKSGADVDYYDNGWVCIAYPDQ